jgi:hypothetical protein
VAIFNHDESVALGYARLESPMHQVVESLTPLLLCNSECQISTALLADQVAHERWVPLHVVNDVLVIQDEDEDLNANGAGEVLLWTLYSPDPPAPCVCDSLAIDTANRHHRHTHTHSLSLSLSLSVSL